MSYQPKYSFLRARSLTAKAVILKGFVLAALLSTYATSAQTVYFTHISHENGLRNGNVRAIAKDYQGFMWFGTEDGLHRFDGYTMKIYRNIKDDSTSLGSNYILCLFEDSAKNLWIGTLDGGLYRYNRKQDSFRHFQLYSQSNSATQIAIRSITEIDGYLYVGSDKLVRSRLNDSVAMHFEQISFPNDFANDPGIRITSIVENSDSTILLSVYRKGLFQYNKKNGEVLAHQAASSEKDIQTIYLDKTRGLVWTGSWRNGILIYDPVSGKHTRLVEGTDSKSIRSNFIAAITGDHSGNIWIATDKGLSMVPAESNPLENGIVVTYLPSKSDQTGIHGTVMKSVYVDDRDKVWIGTYYEGLNVYDKNSMNFGSLSVLTESSNLLSLGNVNALQEDQNGNLWIGIDGGGLYYFEGSLNQSKDSGPVKVNINQNVDKIKSMKIDKTQNLWIGTWGNGLVRLNLTSRTSERIGNAALGANIGNEVVSLETDRLGNVWIGAFDNGLLKYSTQNKSVEKITGEKFNPNRIDRVVEIYADEADNIWIGKEAGGLNLLRKGEKVYRPIQTGHLDLSTTISAIYKDNHNIFWVGSPNLGLIEYDPDKQQTHLYGEDQGLKNSAIYDIREDNKERLWISHNAGISVFDKKAKHFTNFSRDNGLTASQFNRNSSAALKDGYFAFGNIRGVNYFRPDDFRPEHTQSPIAFTRFLIHNVEQLPGRGVLTENIVTTSEINLNHSQNSFSIEFAALDYNFSNSAEYSYLLEGFDKDWQIAGTRRLVSYTNLLPDTYLFKVRAGNNDYVKELRIVIVPAWWQTTAFRMALLVTLIILAWLIHRVRIRYLVKQKRLLEEQVEVRTEKLNKTVEDINAMNLVLHEKQDEILAQNEELHAQNEQIVEQQESLIRARELLKESNLLLEKTVDQRTEKLQETIGDLNKTLFELDRFVYSASHDLSAPLKSIRGLVEIIRIETDPVKAQEYMSHIKNTVLKLETVIKSMIDFSRNAHVLVKSENFRLKDLINEVVGELAFWPDAGHLKYVNEVGDSVMVYSDRARVKIILHNLVSNGIKYADRAKDESWIRFVCEQKDKEWVLRISDNGIGIRHEHLDKVFNMYFRATDLSKGSGLGLFIVKETIRKIGGNVTVHSTFGSSTVFTLEIPEMDFQTT